MYLQKKLARELRAAGVDVPQANLGTTAAEKIKNMQKMRSNFNANVMTRTLDPKD